MSEDLSAPEEMTFEQAIERLEEIVAQLDRGDLALEEALRLYREGTALRQLCERRLAEAEAVVEQLLEMPETDASEAEEKTATGDANGEPMPPKPLFGEDEEA